MKKLFMLLVLCLVGLGGYQLGRQPGSPDVVGHLQGQAARVDWQAVGHKANDAFGVARQHLSSWADSRQPAAAPARDVVSNTPASPSASAVGTAHQGLPKPEDFPQCW